MLGAFFLDIRKGDVLRYMFMPQVMPRLYAFAESGFSNLALMIAMVYRSLNLLPATHSVFLRENRNHLTLRNVIGAAASQLTFNWANADKVLVFFAVLAGLIMLALQFVVTVCYLMMNPAIAQDMPQNYGDFFADHAPKDVAYLLLFAVFGVPEIFKTGGTRTDFHVAMHELFQLYSIGLLVVAVIIICYFIFAVVVETAQTGVPFGKRYNHVWTPIRLVFALGLLIPVGYGLNSAQWITLYSAKFGSDFATKGWIKYNETMNQAYLENAEERVGTPKVPNIKPLVAYMTVVLACEKAYEKNNKNWDIQAYVVSEADATMTGPPVTLATYTIDADIPQSPDERDEPKKARKDVLIRFGLYDSAKFTNERGHVLSICGDLVIHFGDATQDGSILIQESYLKLVRDLWSGKYGIKEAAIGRVSPFIREAADTGDPPPQPDMNYRSTAINEINEYLGGSGTTGGEIGRAVQKQANSDAWQTDINNIRERGWGGAGIWYNKIAQINGSLVTSVANIPQARSMPRVMEYVKQKQLQQNKDVAEAYSLNLSGGYKIEFSNHEESTIAPALKVVYDDWAKDPNFGDLSNQTQLTGNFFIDAINVIFGTQGLFAMCQNTDVHPLAQLSMLGKGLVEASIRNLATGIGFSGLATIPVAGLGQIGGAVSSILMSVAGITIVMGFLLYYVLPFMPFLYFFFAVGGWIKGLFEAMVGVPLWALSFLRIDGEGLPGDPGMTGIYLIFEIFLRPILIIFGLLASVIVFAAMVKILNEVFYLVVQNVSGHDPNSTAMCGGVTPGGNDAAGSGNSGSGSAIDFFRGPVDELFFTVMYAIVVYMIGMSCFKLIDLIPNNILRYMGASVNTFNDKAADPADGLMFRLSVGGDAISGKIIGQGGLISSATSAAQNLGGAAANAAKGPQGQ